MATIDGFDLAAWREAATAIEAELFHLVDNLTEAQFHAPPRSGGWSVGFCIEHLVLTGRALLPKWDQALRGTDSTSSNGKRPLRYPWWQRRILRYAEQPAKLKRRTTPAFEPCTRRSVRETVVRFLEMHRELTRRAAASQCVDVCKIMVKSPLMPWFRYTLGFSLDLILAHERRHIRQAWNVRSDLVDPVMTAPSGNSV